MVQTAQGSALVAGAIPSTPMTNMTIKATRGFLYRGKAIAADTVLEDVPRGVALELIAMSKAVEVAPETEKPMPPRRGRPPIQEGTKT